MEDVKELLDRQRVRHRVPESLIATKFNPATRPVSQEARYEKYFRPLSEEDKDFLYKLYEYDFKAFSYTPDEYF